MQRAVLGGALLGAALLVLIGAGSWLFRADSSSNPGALAVGDCFDQPASDQPVEGVRFRGCSEPHGAEVILVADYLPEPSRYPTDVEVFDFISPRCIAAFRAYTGRSYEDSSDLDFAVLRPTADGWARNDRRVICYAIKADGSNFEASIRAPTAT